MQTGTFSRMLKDISYRLSKMADLSSILAEFRVASEAAIKGLPEPDSVLRPENGISLLDAKNEIFLSYLQALALRNLNVIRSLKEGADSEAAQNLSDEITKKLVEHRVYLERGIRPLEQKLKFQVDRVVKAADEAERIAAQQTKRSKETNGRKKSEQNGKAGDEESEDDSEDVDDDDDDSEDDDEDEQVDKTAFRPNLSAMTSKDERPATKERPQAQEDGVYRPPRVSATVMPTTDRHERAERKSMRSKTLDEFVANEYSLAPTAQPSIGSNIAAGGRTNKDARQLKDEQERRDYEEMNLVRLPKQSKKELARKGYGRDKDGGFGGEDWRDLSTSVDRIGDLTRRKSKDTVLDKSRKRRAVEDGPRGDGIGSQFDVKRKRMQRRGQM
jgi:U3 small nucleolar ribonucleoprotein protein LCP5